MAYNLEGFNQRPDNRIIPYGDYDFSPFCITTRTHEQLGNLRAGTITPATFGGYVKEMTLPFYVRRAVEGAAVLYSDEVLQSQSLDPEIEEAARHGFVVMAWMHEVTKWKFVPTGFSRKGMLAAPATDEEYVARMTEIYLQLKSIYDPNVNLPGSTGTYMGRLRTFSFFLTAATLPIHLSDSQRITAEMERERLIEEQQGFAISAQRKFINRLTEGLEFKFFL